MQGKKFAMFIEKMSDTKSENDKFNCCKTPKISSKQLTMLIKKLPSS